MKITDVDIAGLKVIELDLFKDNRGFFIERFAVNKFKEHGIQANFMQDNHSRSYKNVLRGLHFQIAPAQGKLVGVLRGKIWDIAVDIRPNSPTFKKHFALELSDANAKLLWIPPGFAHGFCVIGDTDADVFYKVDQFYNGKGDRAIRWNDPELNIQWPVREPILSAKDMAAPFLKEAYEACVALEKEISR